MFHGLFAPIAVKSFDPLCSEQEPILQSSSRSSRSSCLIADPGEKMYLFIMRWLLTAGLILYLVQANAQTPPMDEQADKATNFSDVAGSPYLFRDWSEG